MLRVLFALSVFVAACTPGAPAPTALPATPAPATLAPATVAPATPAATPSPVPTTAAVTPRPATPVPPAECDPRYDDCGAADTPPPDATPAGDTLVIGTSTENTYLVAPNGMSLYTFDNDSAGTSACYGNCADSWPPLIAAAGQEVTAGAGVVGTLDTTERNNGALQVTYNGQPLYFFAGDSAPGDTNGHTVGDVWYLAQP